MKGRTSTGLVALAVVALLAACGSGSGPAAKPAVVVAGAPGKTTHGSARLEARTIIEQGGHRLVVQETTGAQDFDARRATMSMRALTDPGDPASMRTALRVVQHYPTTWESIAGVALPGGAHWIRAVPGDLGVDESEGRSLGSQDPSDGLQFLSAVRDARRIGPATVRGEATTRYRVSIDLRRMLDLLQHVSKAMAPQLAEGLRTLQQHQDVSALPGSVWIDGSGRVRRFEYTMPVTPAAGPPVRIVSDLEYFDFGAAVQATPPDASDTVPFSVAQPALKDFFARAQSQTGAPTA